MTNGRWSGWNGRRKLEEEGVTGKMLGNVGCRKCHIHTGSDFREESQQGAKRSGERNQQPWKRYLVIK